MLDIMTFGAKLREHRRSLGLTQENVAAKIGVSAQAVSKWEGGECLPDVFNLKAISEVYGVSADILLETEKSGGVDSAASKIGQIADEYVWSACEKRGENSHRDLGEDLLKLWKPIYFTEAGDREKAREDAERGDLRILSDFGMKLWDDDGIVCVVKNSLCDKLSFGEREEKLLGLMGSHDGLRLIAALDPVEPIQKDRLLEVCGICEGTLDRLLIAFIGAGIAEHVNAGFYKSEGYKLCAKCGIAAYMLLAAAHILSKKKYTLSEYIPG